jgi:glycosyltransferase involved in cell wall biosynthesis
MYPPHSYGGYELSCRDVVHRWAGRGHQIEVLTSRIRVPAADGQAAPAIEQEVPVPVRRQLHLYWRDHVLLSPSLPRRLLWERSNQETLRRVLDGFRPDVVSVWAMGAMSFGLLTAMAERGVPTVHVVCDEWPVYGPNMDAWIRLFLGRPRAARMTSFLTHLPTRLPDLDAMGPTCFNSTFLCEAVRRRSRWSFPRSSVVYPGIESADFPFFDSGDRPWRWRMLYVGRIDSRKGIDSVLRALVLCPPEATLTICGSGDDAHLEELRRLADDLGLGQRVWFTRAPRAELARHYQTADVLVFPSVWEEPFGLVPIEAMSCGTPVVATSVGGAAEFLRDDDNCLVFTPSDPKDLARAVGRLAADPELRARVVAGGRRTAGGFGVDRLAAELETWHRRVAEQP